MQKKINNEKSKGSLNENSYQSVPSEGSDHAYYNHPPYPIFNPNFMVGAPFPPPPFGHMLSAGQEENLIKAREAEERRKELASKLKMPKYFKNFIARKNLNKFFSAPGVFKQGMTQENMDRIICKEWSLLSINERLKWVNYNFARQLKKKKQEEDNLAKGRMRMQSHIQPHQQLHHKNIPREQSVAREILPQQSLISNEKQPNYCSAETESSKKLKPTNNPRPIEIGHYAKAEEFKPQINLTGNRVSCIAKDKAKIDDKTPSKSNTNPQSSNKSTPQTELINN